MTSVGVRSMPAPPDGGWGWMIVLGGAISHIMIGIIVRSIGVFYLEFMNQFGASATVTAWLPAFGLGLWNGLGPVTSSLCNKFGCRIITIIGALLMTIGLVVTGLTDSIILTYFSFGLFLGVGLSLMYLPGYILVGEYFEQRKAVALAISTIGSSAGAFFGPPLIDFLFKSYGYFGAFLIIGGIAFHVLITGALYRPITTHHAFELAKMKRDQLNNVENCGSGDTIEDTPESKPKKKKKTFDFSLLTDWTFVLVCLMYVFLSVTLSTVITFLPALGLDHGIDEKKSVLLLSSLGISDCIFRIPLGYILDLKRVQPIRTYLYVTCMLINGLSIAAMPLLAFNYWVLLISCAIRGAVSSVLMPQRLTFLGDLFGREKAPSGLGLLMLAMAVGSLLARVTGGLFKDYLGTYDPIFYIGGGTCAIIAAIVMVVIRIRKKTQEKQESMEIDVTKEETVPITVNGYDGKLENANLKRVNEFFGSVHSIDI